MDGIRLVASDLDGTLLLPDETVSERTRAALAAARAAGITVVLVSGRQPRSLGPIAERIGVGGIAICANGALVWDLDTGTVVDATPLAADLAARLVHALRDAIPGVLFAVELQGGFGREPGWAEDPSTVPPEAPRPTPELITVPSSPRSATRPWLEELAERPAGPSATRALGRPAAGRDPAAATKAFALAACRRLGSRAAESWPSATCPTTWPCWSGRARRWANATQEVLDAADEVTAANVEDGVARLLERILAANGARRRP
jgi:hypothetical protein